MSKSSAQRRREKAAEIRAQRQREARRNKILKTAGAVTAAVVVVGGVGFAGYMEYKRRNIDGVQEFSGLTNNHVTESVDYDQSPPVGGDHNSLWQNCGVYAAPLEPTHAVHSLEHGAVWINYDPDLPADQVEQLDAFYTPGSYVIVSPYEGELESPVVATAWGKMLAVDGPDDDRLKNFVQLYERNPNVPEPGAACSGQVDLTAAEIDDLRAQQEGAADDPAAEEEGAPAEEETPAG
ncbi:DUF3105 domain-containing protein [Nocardiopsis ansamitocini]|uniref:DUF3105 domain-containing protein n=1 Tax=Nocardiopsis ansamitocini TaxID=1670832 RepID=A0A9W6UG58_9ACTN|nr:DUF3105 domain-containing protein [Nocardiopsis ansamitocini]GLU46621.1 hypothetical protein Nans01_09720 [Nocardiopsis ansamitocini]